MWILGLKGLNRIPTPQINMQILITVFTIFLMVLTRRTCLTIKTFNSLHHEGLRVFASGITVKFDANNRMIKIRLRGNDQLQSVERDQVFPYDHLLFIISDSHRENRKFHVT